MSPLIDSGYAWRRLLASVIISTMGGIGMWALAVAMPAWAGTPRLSRISPPGGQRGTTIEVDLVGRHFDTLGPTERAKPEAASYAGGERRDERDLEQAHVVLGFPSVGYHHPDHHAFQVFSTLFGGGSASRLFQQVREKRGLAYSVASAVSPFDYGAYMLGYVGTRADQTEASMAIMRDEWKKMRDGGPTQKELDEAKRLVKQEMEGVGKQLKLSVPLKVDLGTGHNWRVAHP